MSGNKYWTPALPYTTQQLIELSDFRYWMLDVSKVYTSGTNAWDRAVHDASEEYKHRMVRHGEIHTAMSSIYIFTFFPISSTLFAQKHNLCCDNCHSHVAMALNLMRYENSTTWNMIKLCLLVLIHGKHVRWGFWNRVRVANMIHTWFILNNNKFIFCLLILPFYISAS